MLRFFVYGLLGWCAEIAYTGLAEQVRGVPDWSLRGTTYLWMLPVYGAGALLVFEPVHRRIRALPWAVRGLAWVPLVFALEYLTGFLLEQLTGRCPWDYGGASLSVDGYIRLDYAPLWFVLGLLFEQVHARLLWLDAAFRLRRRRESHLRRHGPLLRGQLLRVRVPPQRRAAPRVAHERVRRAGGRPG